MKTVIAQAPADRRPVGVWIMWIAVATVPPMIWLALLRGGTEALFLDWGIYAHGWDLWQTAGSPYEVLPSGWNPCSSFPYLYPPSSWPLMPVAAVVPAVAVGLAAIPLLARPPRFWFLPLGAAFLALGLGPALYLGNVNLIVAGLLVLAFRPGRAGGVALGLVVAIKLYPIVLLPLLWGDRTRLRWSAWTFGGLALSGTLFFGAAGWLDFATTLLNEGPHCAATWNPLADLGGLRIAVAGAIALCGLALKSPTIALVGTTWLSGVVTAHYFVTFAATVCREPSIATTIGRLQRRFGRGAIPDEGIVADSPADEAAQRTGAATPPDAGPR